MATLGSKNVTFTVRNLRREEVCQLKSLSDIEGWNSSHEDWLYIYDMNPDGFFAAVTSDGEVISMCGAVLLDDNTGFLSVYITKTEMRGQGIGRQVYDKVMHYLGDRNIAISAVAEKENMYKAGDFKISAFRAAGYKAPLLNPSQSMKRSPGVDIVNINDVEFEKITAFDASFCSLPRAAYLHAWLNSSAKSCVATRDGAVVGYGAIRQRPVGFRLSPLYADDATIAEMLWDALVRDLPKACQVNVSMPAINDEAIRLFTDLGMTNSTPSYMVRMFTKTLLPVDLAKVYSICNHHSAIV